MNTEIRFCRFCDKPLKGRTDKKYCNDYCRNAFNNRVIEKDSEHIRQINSALRRNHRILEEILPVTTNKSKIVREILLSKGFQFKYFTHIRQSKKGTLFYCCYDYGYNPLGDKKLLIVRHKENKV